MRRGDAAPLEGAPSAPWPLGRLPPAWGITSPLVALAAVLVAVGVAFRLLAPFVMDLRQDGQTYAALGWAWSETQSFVLPWGNYLSGACTGPEPAHHFPPVYPLYLGVVYEALGFGVATTKFAAVVASLAAVGVVFALTQDLYGRSAAWLAAAVIALDPTLLWATGAGFSESLVAVFFAITLWAVLRSLEDGRWILVAGVAGAITYLTRASMGPLFLVAAIGGLAWRFAYVRKGILRERYLLLAVAVFVAIAAAWATQNVNPPGLPSNLGLFGQGLALKGLLALALTAHVALPLGKELARSARRFLEERESLLWLAVLLVVGIAWVMTALFWTVEQYPWWWLNDRRYVLIAFVPLLWLALRHADIRDRGFQLRFGVLLGTLLVWSCYIVVEPVKFPEAHLAEELSPILEPGDQIGFEGILTKYAFFPYLNRVDVDVYGCLRTATDPCVGQRPDYILSLRVARDHPGYRLLHTHTIHYTFPWLDGPDWTGYTYIRETPRLEPLPGCLPHAV